MVISLNEFSLCGIENNIVCFIDNEYKMLEHMQVSLII